MLDTLGCTLLVEKRESHLILQVMYCLKEKLRQSWNFVQYNAVYLCRVTAHCYTITMHVLTIPLSPDSCYEKLTQTFLLLTARIEPYRN